MALNELSKKEKKDALLFGAIVGALAIILSIVSIYLTHASESYSGLFFWSTLLKILSSIILPIFFVYLLKRRNGKDWTFSTALKSIYILLAASIVVSYLGITIHQKTMDKIVLEESYQNLMNLKIVDMEAKNASEDEIDQQIEIIEKEKEFALTPFSFRNAIPPIFISLLLNFIFALVLALLFRAAPNKHVVTKQ